MHLTSGSIFVDDEIWVIDNATKGGPYWVELGEVAQYGGVTSYFWADNRPGSTFFFHDLGAVPGGDFGQNVIYLIEKYDPTPGQWDLAIFSPSVKDLRYLVQSTGNAMNANQDIMGQELAGTIGASAEQSAFSWAWDIPFLFVGKTRATDGSVRSDNPPSGRWAIAPSSPNSSGGTFVTSCC